MAQGTIGINVLGNVGGLISGLQKGSQAVTNFASGLTNTLGKIGMASIGVSALFNTMKSALGTPFKLSANMESTSVAFETLTGSVEKSKKILGELKTFAKVTPFSDEEVFEAGKKFTAFGVEANKLIPTMTSMGNIASLLNIPFSEMADMVGRMKVGNIIQAEDLNQLQGRGIPAIEALSKVLQISTTDVKKYASAGRIEFKHLEAALTNLGNTTFADGMEKQSKTLGGIWSNLSAGATESLTKVGDKLVETFNIKGLLTNASTFLEGFTTSAFAVFDGLVAGVQVAMPVISAFGTTCVAIWESITTGASQLWNWLTSSITVNTEKFTSQVIYGLQLVQFGFQNFGAVAKLAGYDIVLGLVKVAANVDYFFVNVIPQTLQWFGRNWKEMFYNLGVGIVSIFRNVGQSIVNVLKNIGGLLSGSVKWSDVLVPLMKDAQFAFVEALKIDDRVKGQLETQLENSIDEQAKSLAAKYAEFRKAKDAAMGLTDNKSASALTNNPALTPTPKPSDKAPYKEIKIAASKSGKEETKLNEAALRGTKESAEIMLRTMFGGKNDPQQQTAKNTAATVKGINALTQAVLGFANTKGTKVVGII